MITSSPETESAEAVIERRLDRQHLENCALLCAYVFGSPRGWYSMVETYVGGLRSDYALIRAQVGDYDIHPTYLFMITGREPNLIGLDALRIAIRSQHGMVAEPRSEIIAQSDIDFARGILLGAFETDRPAEPGAWLRSLCLSSADFFALSWTTIFNSISGHVPEAEASVEIPELRYDVVNKLTGAVLAEELTDLQVFDWALRNNRDDDFDLRHFQNAARFRRDEDETAPLNFRPGFAVRYADGEWDFDCSLDRLLGPDNRAVGTAVSALSC